MTEHRVILNFHGIGTPHPGIAADEQPYWISENFFREIIELASARQDIGLTFDDGNASDLLVAAPLLAARGIRGEFFVLTGRLGQPCYLSLADCWALLAMGHSVGLHGRDHLNWRALDGRGFDRETGVARQELANGLGVPVDTVGIPFGAYDRKVIARLRAAGFKRIYTSDGGIAGRGTVRSRTSIRADMALDDVAAILAAREPLKRRVRRRISTFLRRHIV